MKFFLPDSQHFQYKIMIKYQIAVIVGILHEDSLNFFV